MIQEYIKKEIKIKINKLVILWDKIFNNVNKTNNFVV